MPKGGDRSKPQWTTCSHCGFQWNWTTKDACFKCWKPLQHLVPRANHEGQGWQWPDKKPPVSGKGSGNPAAKGTASGPNINELLKYWESHLATLRRAGCSEEEPGVVEVQNRIKELRADRLGEKSPWIRAQARASKIQDKYNTLKTKQGNIEKWKEELESLQQKTSEEERSVADLETELAQLEAEERQEQIQKQKLTVQELLGKDDHDALDQAEAQAIKDKMDKFMEELEETKRKATQKRALRQENEKKKEETTKKEQEQASDMDVDVFKDSIRKRIGQEQMQVLGGEEFLDDMVKNATAEAAKKKQKTSG